MSVILKVEDLTKYFQIKKTMFGKTPGVVRAVDGVSFELMQGETLSLVGESRLRQVDHREAGPASDPAHPGKRLV